MSGLHIKRFIDRLQSFESRGIKDFSCPLQDAKNLHSDITRLLLDLEAARAQTPTKEETVTIQLEGGSF
jgi:hypothetical protein